MYLTGPQQTGFFPPPTRGKESMGFLSLKDITSAKPEVVLPVFFSIFNPSFESKVWGVKPMVRVRKKFCTPMKEGIPD